MIKQGLITTIKDIIKDRKEGLIDENVFQDKILQEFDIDGFIEEKKYILRCLLKVVPDESLSFFYEILNLDGKA